MKRIISLLCGVTLLLSTNSSVFAGNSYDSGYKSPILKNDFYFTAKRDGYNVSMNWKKYNLKEELKYYKVVRSTKNATPVYPDDGYIKYDSNIDFTNYTHVDKDSSLAYYRICAITNLNNRYCSNVVKVIGYTGEKVVEKKEDVKKEVKIEVKQEIKKEEPKNESGLSESQMLKAKRSIYGLITKLDKTDYTNDKKVEVINTIITKLNNLKAIKASYTKLVDYMILLLEEKKTEYSEDLEIENILNIEL